MVSCRALSFPCRKGRSYSCTDRYRIVWQIFAINLPKTYQSYPHKRNMWTFTTMENAFAMSLINPCHSQPRSSVPSSSTKLPHIILLSSSAIDPPLISTSETYLPHLLRHSLPLFHPGDLPIIDPIPPPSHPAPHTCTRELRTLVPIPPPRQRQRPYHPLHKRQQNLTTPTQSALIPKKLVHPPSHSHEQKREAKNLLDP